MMQQCIKCNVIKEMSEFINHGKPLKKGTPLNKRQVCYECNYVNINRKKQFNKWSDNEKMERLKSNFEKQVVRKEDCWDWKGFVRPDGYVRVCFGGRPKAIGGHVASYMIHHNLLDLAGAHVLHICDNRKCTNPDHLFLGTYSDNMIDMVHKKRNPIIKLTPVNIRHIRMMLKNKISCTHIAKLYKVHRGTINDIKLGKTWRHV